MYRCSNQLEFSFQNEFDEDIYKFLDSFDISTRDKILAISNFSYGEGFSKGYESNVKRDGSFKYTKGYCNALDEVIHFVESKISEVR